MFSFGLGKLDQFPQYADLECKMCDNTGISVWKQAEKM
jgi:hypothetical protein